MKNFYHIGIVTPDIKTAINEYRQKHQAKFTTPVTTKPRLLNPVTGMVEEIDVTVSYSRCGPPYIEFIQAVGGGIFSEKNSGKILYYGLWEKTIDKRIEKLRQQGTGIDALVSQGDSPAIAVITAPDPLGVRIEYVATALQGYIKAWTITDKVPGENLLSTALAGLFGVCFFIRNLFNY